MKNANDVLKENPELSGHRWGKGHFDLPLV